MSFQSFRKMVRTATGAAAICAAALTTTAHAQGDLLVAPTRVILDGSRGTEVILSNIGSEEATYRIGLELRRMEENGRLAPVERIDASDAEEAALGMIRYAPRRITLPPGQPQAVRLAARPSADLADGEYRVHMSFKAIPRAQEVTSNEVEAEGVSIKLIPIYGVTIPIIVRHGRLQAQVAINQPSIVEGENGPELSVLLSRTGDSSTYGTIKVTKPGAEEPLVLLRGIAVYSELGEREVRVPLTPEQVAQFSGQVRIEYRTPVADGDDLIAAVDSFLG